MQARDWIRRLSLQAHPEGGWYKEFYRSATPVAGPQGRRAALTGIYYLLEHGRPSRWHVVASDEIWTFYGGASLEVFTYEPASKKLSRRVLEPLGTHEPVVVVAAGVWQAARSLGDFSLAGCYVAPGFEFTDFRFVSAVEGHAGHFTGPLERLSELL